MRSKAWSKLYSSCSSLMLFCCCLTSAVLRECVLCPRNNSVAESIVKRGNSTAKLTGADHARSSASVVNPSFFVSMIRNIVCTCSSSNSSRETFSLLKIGRIVSLARCHALPSTAKILRPSAVFKFVLLAVPMTKSSNWVARSACTLRGSAVIRFDVPSSDSPHV